MNVENLSLRFFFFFKEKLQQNLVDHSNHREQNPEVLKGPLKRLYNKFQRIEKKKEKFKLFPTLYFQCLP